MTILVRLNYSELNYFAIELSHNGNKTYFYSKNDIFILFFFKIYF
ncbi:hypothetical protein PMAG_a3750 [Pseudoalteromonas mariniglutinosa NCIMB 1770]|nr:hypothetical protein [Pseudoalteromonas mariniglutinosa NCIMB 1770]